MSNLLATAPHVLNRDRKADKTRKSWSADELVDMVNDMLAVERGFERATAEAIQMAHDAGLPVPILRYPDRTAAVEGVVWLHPDGIVRPEREPIHLAVGD